MFRGCLSDATKVRLLCEQKNKSNKGTCVLCSNTGCNNQPKERQPELTCVNCTGSEECAFGYNASMAISCEKNVALGDEESCFTRLINGNTIWKIFYFEIFHSKPISHVLSFFFGFFFK